MFIILHKLKNVNRLIKKLLTKTSSNQKGSLLEEKSLEKLPFACSAEKKENPGVGQGVKGQKKDLAATYSPALLQYHRRESA